MIDHGKERHLDVGVVLRSEQDFLLLIDHGKERHLDVGVVLRSEQDF